MDKLLEALKRAEKVWRATQHFTNKEKFAEAQALHSYGVFSFNQLAKICRTNVPYLTRRLPKVHAVGGRFEPEALSALIVLRAAHLQGVAVSWPMVRIAQNAGCSLSSIATLTGLPRNTLYRKTNEKKRLPLDGEYTTKEEYYIVANAKLEGTTDG